MSADMETVVIGAGVVGLAIAHHLAKRGHDVWVLERNDRIGAETSSRNSEVIHAGLYYPTQSLRAKFCVAGKHALYKFTDENGVPHKKCGKLVVATSDADCEAIENLKNNAKQNGVDDLISLKAAEARELEPELSCKAALLSPSTGVIDSHALMVALEGHINAAGGQVVLNTAINNIAPTQSHGFQLTTSNDDKITCKNLIISAGLGAQELMNALLTSDQNQQHNYRPPTRHLAKGHYFTLAGRTPFSRLIYPMPSGAWLGVHLTLDVAGRAKFGPDLTWTDTLSYEFDDPDGERQKAFVESIRRFWPALPDNALSPDYTGIRPKIYGKGEPVADFAIHSATDHGIPNLIALFGIESPGLTSCLAIGEHVAQLVNCQGEHSVAI